MGFFEAFWDIFTSDTTYLNGALFAALLRVRGVRRVGRRACRHDQHLGRGHAARLGALASAVGYDVSGSVRVGLLMGMVGGFVVAAVQAEMSHHLAADQFVVGLTLNILVIGLAGFLDRELDPTTTFAGKWEIPLLSDLPLVGEALFGQRWPFYLLYPLVPLSWWLVFHTRWGLEVRAAGESPQSADVSGIHVNRRRRETIYYAGLTSGLGGAFMVFVNVGSFDDSVIGGRGFIAIAAVIFGGWTLKGTIAGCIVFAGALSFRLSIQGLGYGLNSEFLQSLPFLVTILGMALFAHRVRAPAGALARPFVRGLN